MSLRILVCGSRDWQDAQAIHDRLALVPYVQPYAPTVIHGAASRIRKGREVSADMLADAAARSLGMAVEPYPAAWEPGPETRVVKRRRDGTEYDPEAGRRRNLAMLDTGPHVVLAFQKNGSRGTQHTIEQARKRGIPVEVFTA